ncbi:G protein pathway suppressor 2-like [Ornithodoros turicata]|uniref:Putative myosin class ii heavy chain n=1 Tax=Ornithodoros turicata TaxID=34597 RepID=A0A2R5LNS4_9ACAR
MPALIERPKMSLQMWAALKAHIMRERERKKQEQEADEAIERLRREQEQKRKQDQMTLEEIKDQVVQSEKKLKELKDEKHQLFMQLKKVLHEDETRRRALIKEANEMAAASQAYASHQGIAVTQPQSLYIQNVGRTPVLYKMTPQTNNSLHSVSLKRPLTPSPPPPHATSAYQPQYTYKAQVTAFGPKLIPYPSSVAQQATPVYYTTHHIVSGASSAMTDAAIYSYGAQYAAPAVSPRKHLAVPSTAYGHVTQGFTRAIPQQLEHGNPKPSAYPSDEKFYVQAGVMQRAPVGGSLTTGQPVVAVQRQLGGTFGAQQALQQRHPYPSQQGTRFY